MSFRKPVLTLGGNMFWENLKQTEEFLLQKNTAPIWPYKYRIIMRNTRYEIANSNDLKDIEYDWRFLENNVVPQLDNAVDPVKTMQELSATLSEKLKEINAGDVLALAAQLVKISQF